MNIHHLELFYYVARHGGISQAVRNIPYGIQQPAVSSQIIRLEEFLGVTLFQRRPFQLSVAGAELYEFCRPFFSNLPAMTEKLCGGATQQLRVGASETVLRDHLPAILQTVRKRFPQLKLTLREGYQPELESWLQMQELDVAVTLLEGKPPAGVRAQPLLELPLALLVPKSSRWNSARELWASDRIGETLIALPPSEPICRHFCEGLRARKVDWLVSIEVSSLDLIEAYVANGFGIGLSIAIPKGALNPKLRLLPLDDFAPVRLGVLWQGQLTPVKQAFNDAVRRTAQSLSA
ncbi:MAG: LysR family transcriptional regulator [Verrucomicrobia bacterium]|nr:LysR family transcriptional regulator [Verrucomicrobiota bacterium]